MTERLSIPQVADGVRRRGFRSVAFVTMVSLLVLGGATAASATPVLSTSVTTFVRDSQTGTLTFDVEISTGGFTSSDCSWGCNVAFVGYVASGGATVLWSSSANPGTQSYRAQGSAGWDQGPFVSVGAILSSAYGSTFQSVPAAVSDFIRGQSMSVVPGVFERNVTTGDLSWAVSYELSAIPANACTTWGCKAQLIAVGTDNNEYLLSEFSVTNRYFMSGNLSGTFGGTYQGYVGLVSVSLKYGSVSSASAPIDDEVESRRLDVAVDNFVRNQTTGQLDWAVTIDAADLPSSLCTSWGCKIQLIGELHGGGEVLLAEKPLLNNYHYTFPATGSFQQYQAISRIQARFGSFSGGWVDVDDYVRAPSMKLVIDTFLRDANGTLNWSIDIPTSQVTSDRCNTPSGYCKIQLIAKTELGDEVVLAETVRLNPYAETYQLSGSYSGSAKIVNLQARYGTLQSGWLTNSESIKSGHDLDEVALLLVAGIPAGVEPSLACTTIFGVGSHFGRSSLSDQDFACRASVASGKTLLQALVSALKTVSSKDMVKLMLEVTRTTTGLTTESPLPSGCTWVAIEISCTNGTSTTVQKPDDAPPALDKTYEENILNEMTHNNPAPIEIPQGGALEQLGATDESVRLHLARECISQLSRPIGTSAITVGGLTALTPDDCGSRNVLFIGGLYKGSPFGAIRDHTVEALQEHPEFTMLTYISNAEKGVPRPTWRDVAPAQCGSMPDEYQCDEFPYFSTTQGYPASWPSLLPVPGSQNSSQGALLNSFYGGCGLRSYPQGSDERTFLVITTSLPVSDYVCHG